MCSIRAKVFVYGISETALRELEQNVPEISTNACDISYRNDIENMVVFGAEALGLKTNKDDVSFLNEKAAGGLLTMISVKLG